MTDQLPNDTDPTGEPASESTGDAWGSNTSSTWGTDAGATDTGATPESAQSREWMTQLESMIKGIATQAAPVAKEIGAKAAELAAVAAVKAGPAASRAAELTNEYGAKFAERAKGVAADLRSQAATDASTNGSSTNGHTADAVEPSPEETTGTGV